jgi:protoheme IX farnesyltransferase
MLISQANSPVNGFTFVMIRFKQEHSYKRLHRFAVLTAVATIGLIIAGAMVTSTGSGDAVPDWPLSYGTLAPPMIGGILYEHTHRLVAGFTGLLIAILAFWLWRTKTGRALQWLGLAAFAGVILQASLGGLRVLLVSTDAVQETALRVTGAGAVEPLRIAVAVTHAFMAQTILCLLFAIAILTSKGWRNLSPVPPLSQSGRKIFRVSIVFAGLIFLQLLLGALVRHCGAGLIIPDFPLSFGSIIPPFGKLPYNPSAPFPLTPGELQFKVLIHFTHRVTAVIILGTVLYICAVCRKTPRMDHLSRILLLLTLLQIMLGALNIWTAKSVYTTVLHVATGALLLAGSITLALFSRRLFQSKGIQQELPVKARAYLELTKPRLTLLVMFSALTGYCLGSPESIETAGLFHALLGIGLASAGALALNQYAEREYDAKMPRTRKRPLPAGRIKPVEALAFGTFLCISAVIYLVIAVNLLTSFLVMITILSYLFAYTPLKRISYFNTAVGAVSGALPIVCGWTAARNALTIESVILFGILFFWQFPHFLSIALLYKDDYQQAGYKMLPFQENGIRRTNRYIITASVALLLVSVFPAVVGLTGKVYLTVALLAGSVFLACGISVALYQTATIARRLMLASFAYPLLVWGSMIADRLRV